MPTLFVRMLPIVRGGMLLYQYMSSLLSGRRS